MKDKKMPELSQKEKDSLDKQMTRLESQIVLAKHKYEDLVSQYSDLFEKRHPEKREERIKEELFNAYRNSTRSLDLRYCHLLPARNGTNSDYRHLV